MARSVIELLPSIPPATTSQDGLASAALVSTVATLDTDNAGAFNFGSIDLSRNTQYTPEPYVQLGTMAFELSGAPPVPGCGFVLRIIGNGPATITYTSDFVAADGSSLTAAPYSGFTGDMVLAVDWHGGLGKARVYMEGTGGGGGGGTMSAAAILAALLTVDGSGSGLDADLLDGQHASALLARANHTGTQLLSTISNAGSAAAADVGAFATALQGNKADTALQPTTAQIIQPATLAAGAVTCNLSLGSKFAVTINGAWSSLVGTNLPTVGQARTIELVATISGTQTINLAGLPWLGVTPTLATASGDVIVLVATWEGSILVDVVGANRA